MKTDPDIKDVGAFEGLLTTEGLDEKTSEEILMELRQLRRYRERADSAHSIRQELLLDRASRLINDTVEMLLPEGYVLQNRNGANLGIDVQTQGVVVIVSGYLHQKGVSDSGVSFSEDGFRKLREKLKQLLPGVVCSGPYQDGSSLRSLQLKIEIPPDRLNDLLKADPITRNMILEVFGNVRAVIQEIPCERCKGKHKFML